MQESAAVAHLRAWRAEPSGEVWSTPSSSLASGVRDGVAVVAKVAHVEEERRGARLLAWWGGFGGIQVLERTADAVLMARATGRRDLAAWSTSGRDDDAVDVLVDAALAVHRMPMPPSSVGLLPLRTWFRALLDTRQSDPLLDRAAGIARGLLTEGEAVALHGDLHHGNVLDLDGERWAAIDPKALLGPREFDLANLFCNPDETVAVTRLQPRLERVADRAGVDEARLADWVIAWCGLSLAWDPDGGWHARASRAVLEELIRRAG